MRIVIAPDKFKGTLSARRAAEAMAGGARAVYPHAEIRVLPVSDGGQGFSESLAHAMGGALRTTRVEGPLGGRVEARYALLPSGDAALEAAAAAGLLLVPEDERDPLRASTFGVGTLVHEASAQLRPRGSVLVGVGDTASTDGGTGAARAVGWRFVDGAGRDVPAGGAGLPALRKIHPPVVRPAFTGRVVAACDVDAPLLGERGAATTFAPQKGAGHTDVARLEDGLQNLARRVAADVGVDVSGLAGGGAGGGLGAGLVAFFGAALRSGFDVVADALGVGDAIRQADVVITGEGSFDDQSFGGKATAGVARLARAAGVGCVLVAGRVAVTDHQLAASGIRSWRSAEEVPGPAERAVAEATRAALRDLP